MTAPWKPQLASVDLRTLPLSAEEGFLVSRIDGHTTVEQLAQLTGLPKDRVGAIMAKLVQAGAVVSQSPTVTAAPTDTHSTDIETADGAPHDGFPPESESPDAEEPEPDVETQGTHLALYRAEFHDLPPEQRTQLATTEQGPRLIALCFDQLPAVIHAILQNPHATHEHARLIAAHHRNAAGLEWLVQRADLMRDAQVQRLLWRNPQLNEGQLRRLVQSKRLLEIWKLAVSREATAQTRNTAAKLLRSRFTAATSEEKLELIFNTEGRALNGLSGVPVDGKTAALLCGRNYASTMLIQNLARWSTAPPSVIAHLLKQPLVMRQPQLRSMLSRHPNAPASAKRD